MDETNNAGPPQTSVGNGMTAQALEAAVEQWWDDHFPGSPVAQVTAAWNRAYAAKEELKQRLAALLQGVL